MKKLNTVSVKDLVRIAGGTAEEALAYYNELLEKYGVTESNDLMRVMTLEEKKHYVELCLN